MYATVYRDLFFFSIAANLTYAVKVTLKDFQILKTLGTGGKYQFSTKIRSSLKVDFINQYRFLFSLWNCVFGS